MTLTATGCGSVRRRNDTCRQRAAGKLCGWLNEYIDAAVAQLRAEGHEIRDEDVARLSPLKHKNLNCLGRYSFTASTPAAGSLRPLRDPDAVELDDDDEG